MVTKQQAQDAGWRTEFHRGACKVHVGPRGGVTTTIETWRVNGRCQTWKRDPSRFCLPVKYGFNGPYTHITDHNAADWHAASECAALREEK
jgi:hypothetical protein